MRRDVRVNRTRNKYGREYLASVRKNLNDVRPRTPTR